jgi:DNA-binding NarL/FixJ family response regulator
VAAPRDTQQSKVASERRLRCVVADDHPAVLDAACRFLAAAADIEVVCRTSDGAQALRLIEEHRPDVALLDIRMPQLSGIEIARRLAASGSSTAVVLYTGYAERAVLLESLDVGVRGFVLKDAPLEDLARALRTVARGATYVDPALAGLLSSVEVTSKLPLLTKREREILRLLADGMRNEQVALQLSISPLTVRTHVKHAMEKLEADTRTEAVAQALRQSLIT